MVLPCLPHPARHGTALRIADMVEALREDFGLGFVALVDEVPGAAALHALGERGELVQLILAPKAAPGLPGAAYRLFYRVRRRLQRPLPDWDCYCPRVLTRAVARAAAAWRPAGVLVSTIGLAPCVRNLPGELFKAIDPMDVWHERCREFSLLGRARELEHYRDPEEEARLLRPFDLVVAITAHDAEVFARMLPGARTTVCGVSHPVVARPPEDAGGPPTVLFAGGRGLFNEDGIRRFAEAAWPRVRARVPAAELVVLSASEGLAAALAGVPGVRALGFVDDLAAWYHRAHVVVVPLRHGSGLKVKAVEALAHGAAVVMTPVAARGLPEASPPAFLVRETPEDFAEAVAALLTDRTARRELQENARALAARALSREAVYADLRRALP